MTLIHVADPEATPLRLAASPLWEVFASIASLEAADPSPWPHGEWERTARQALARRRAAGELLGWFNKLSRIPSILLTPAPDGIGRTVEEHVERLQRRIRHASPQRLAELGIRGDQVGEWARWLSQGLLDYWHVALAPYWPAMQTALRDDLANRALVLATGGIGGVLAGLDARLRWQPPVLEVRDSAGDEPVRCRKRLVAVPMIFGHRTVHWVATGSGTVVVGYQTQGATVLAKPRQYLDTAAAEISGDRLALLLGRGRAAVLRGLTEPATTSQLAASLAMSASTVSQHLSVLVAADVAHRRRDGGRVLYGLGTAGLALLRYLSSELN
ncbi:ArsR/SmtB family transcription factor [Couchioplanes caeruleus]|uniref:HTH arsR-type domain-containing protein n=2 Tax=Couchioplanes caeruleus TaxID=56438 RepID=A0A1K0FJ03_9ACTN|nr:winged helix-turn-helix domain-containing protein [Couchioplanes caeruleus]OJF12821.1 hypothetical protein BG844_18575 [Couchioplanes caeruleus subsp. caeruleus]ROP30670.1 helix-turn-helix protein [Couchioplanes caeruleus]